MNVFFLFFRRRPLSKKYLLARLSGCADVWHFKKFAYACSLVLSVVLLTRSEVKAWQQPEKFPVTGSVTDQTGAVLPNVSVTEKSTSNKTLTNNQGKYSIRVSSKNAVLIFSFTGFTARELPVNAQSVVDASLNESTNSLDQVVVVGYGTQKKSDLTGSVTSVSVKNNAEGAYGNFQQLLSGRAPGVVVNENSGQPGAGMSIEIRGTNSLNFSSQPLYVVDGIPLDIPEVGSLNNNPNALGASAASPLTAINPADIESVEILKDASSTAIYGSRGANGVVLITTKSGRIGKTRITANISNGFTSLLKSVKTLHSADYATYVNEAYTARGLTTGVPFLPAEIPGLPDFDHQKEIVRSARTQDVNLSLSGGDAKSKYYLSGQYFNQEGVVISNQLKRYNFKINYENNVNERLKVSSSINISGSKASGNVANSFAGGYLQSALLWAPSNPLINPDGSFNLLRSYHYGSSILEDPTVGTVYYNPRFSTTDVLAAIDPNFNNPLAFLQGVTNDNSSMQVLGNLNLNYQLSKDLVLAGVLGVTTYNSLLENYIPTTAPRLYTLRGVASIGNLRSTKLLYQTTLTYNKKIKLHSINAVFGATIEDFQSKTQTSSTQSFSTDATGVNAIQAGAVVQIPTSDVNDYKLVSTLFRGSYNYDSRYYLTLSARYDGSSKFAAGNQFGFFPSIGGSWRINKEKWFHVKAVDELKLRASFGVIGNQGIGSYNTLSTLSYAGAVFGGTTNTGYAPSRIPNVDLTWEETRQTNLGIDLNLFNNRIEFTADAYNRETDKLLYQVVLPGSSGFANILQNIGQIGNRGLEFSISSVNVKTDDFKWTTEFNISFNRNKVKRLTGTAGEFLPVQSMIGSAFLSRVTVGEPIGQFYGYRTVGVWNDQTILTKPANFQVGAKEGDRRYEDVNNDGLLNDVDRVAIGSALPNYTGGFSTAFTYKNFDLSVFFSYSVGNDIFNQLNWNLTSMSGLNNILQSAFDQRYIPITASTDPSRVDAIRANNQTTKVMAAGSTMDPREVTDFYIEDGSYLRCRDITLAYRFGPGFTKRLKISNLSVYANLQNMFTITSYSGFNPEVNTGTGLARGLDNGSTPLGRTVRFGINIGL